MCLYLLLCVDELSVPKQRACGTWARSGKTAPELWSLYLVHVIHLYYFLLGLLNQHACGALAPQGKHADRIVEQVSCVFPECLWLLCNYRETVWKECRK